MRSEQEVLAMRDRLQRHNDAIWLQLRVSRRADADDLMATFNANASLLCALNFALGEDTITVKDSVTSVVPEDAK